MTEPSLPETTPSASWGRVGIEVLKHPYKSGALDIGVGTFFVADGIAIRDPYLTSVGGAIDTLGFFKFVNFAGKVRYPNGYFPPGPPMN